MFVYEKKLQYPVRIKNCNPKLASVIISQYGGAYCNKLRYFFLTVPHIKEPHPNSKIRLSVFLSCFIQMNRPLRPSLGEGVKHSRAWSYLRLSA